MQVVHQGIITLIRSAITGEKLSLPEDFSLKEADNLVRKQALLPMAYQGAYTCGFDPKNELMQDYQKKYLFQLMRSQQQLNKINRLFCAFDENGIDYLPLKGTILKPLYPQPELRMMGDADVLIRKEQYEQIKPIMESQGFREDVWSSYDVHWISKELLAELHYRLFSDDHDDLCAYFEDGWSLAVKTAGCRHEFAPEDTFLYIFSHMTKHFRFCGIGARQIVDLYVYRKANPQLDETKIETVMEQMHLLDFYRNIKRLLAVWFEGAPCDPITDFITEYIFSGGSFGTVEKKLYSEELIRAKQMGKIKNSRTRSIFRAIFPTLDYLQLSYNVLYRHSWLFPVFYVVRWVDIILHRRHNIRKKAAIILNISDKGVTDHQQLLNYMGLDFHF